AKITVFAQLRVRHEMGKVPDGGTFSYFRSIIDDRCWMRIVRKRSPLHIRRKAIFTKRVLASLQHLQYPCSALAISARRLASTHAIQQVLALAAQRLILGQRYNLAAVTARHRRAI